MAKNDKGRQEMDKMDENVNCGQERIKCATTAKVDTNGKKLRAKVNEQKGRGCQFGTRTVKVRDNYQSGQR